MTVSQGAAVPKSKSSSHDNVKKPRDDVEKHKYKWVVLAMAVCINGLTWGMLYSVGVLYSDWVRYFDASASYISLAGGLPTAVSCLGGPAFGFLIDKFGCRVSGFAGGVIMALGLALSSLANTVTQLIVTYGVIAGFGAGLSVFSASSAINYYFSRNRALAEGVSGGGLGLGMFAYSYLLQALSNTYTWRGAMLLSGAICFHSSICSIFLIHSDQIELHSFNRLFVNSQATPNDQKASKRKNDDNRLDDKEEYHEDQYSSEEVGFFRRSLALWKSPIFLLLLAVDFLAWIAVYVPYVHLIERARQQGVDPNLAAWLSSACGIASVFGRPFTGFICSYFKLHPFWSYCTMQMILGLGTLLSPFWSDIYGLFALAVLVGFLSNSYGMIKASAARMLGMERFVDAYSWMMLLEGIGIAVGPVIAGVIFDATQSYNLPFHFSGSLLVLSGLMCFLKTPVEMLNRRMAVSVKQKAEACSCYIAHVSDRQPNFQTAPVEATAGNKKNKTLPKAAVDTNITV